MAKGKPFGGKRAAPFAAKGRKSASPRTAKGTPKKKGR